MATTSSPRSRSALRTIVAGTGTKASRVGQEPRAGNPHAVPVTSNASCNLQGTPSQLMPYSTPSPTPVIPQHRLHHFQTFPAKHRPAHRARHQPSRTTPRRRQPSCRSLLRRLTRLRRQTQWKGRQPRSRKPSRWQTSSTAALLTSRTYLTMTPAHDSRIRTRPSPNPTESFRYANLIICSSRSTRLLQS